MIEECVVQHYEHVSQNPFEELISTFEPVVGNGDDGRFLNRLKELSTPAEWEALCGEFAGSSGFLLLARVIRDSSSNPACISNPATNLFLQRCLGTH
jgi:hypothetical protein